MDEELTSGKEVDDLSPPQALDREKDLVHHGYHLCLIRRGFASLLLATVHGSIQSCIVLKSDL